jgi:hypothetical protein
MSSNSDVNRIAPGKSYNSVDEVNYLDTTRRVVKIEQALSGYINEFNAPSIPPVGSTLKWYNSITGVPSTLPGCYQICNGAAITDIYSPMYGQNVPSATGTGYVEVMRIK